MKLEVKIVLRRDLDFTKVRYYTLKFDDDNENELDKFYSKYQDEYQESLLYIKMWIAEIGEKFGAEKRFFRPEDNAEALPPPTNQLACIDQEISQSMDLRLYCIVLSPEVVILVNGGVKESNATRDSPSCWEQFKFTSNISSQINKMLNQGDIIIKGRQLKRKQSFTLSYTR